jgi:hypothetical protein
VFHVCIIFVTIGHEQIAKASFSSLIFLSLSLSEAISISIYIYGCLLVFSFLWSHSLFIIKHQDVHANGVVSPSYYDCYVSSTVSHRVGTWKNHSSSSHRLRPGQFFEYNSTDHVFLCCQPVFLSRKETRLNSEWIGE